MAGVDSAETGADDEEDTDRAAADEAEDELALVFAPTAITRDEDAIAEAADTPPMTLVVERSIRVLVVPDVDEADEEDEAEAAAGVLGFLLE